MDVGFEENMRVCGVYEEMVRDRKGWRKINTSSLQWKQR